MNENAKKWVAALRSGEFRQGKYQLCCGEQYCCLGVLCEIAIRNGVDVRISEHDGCKRYDSLEYDLSERVMKWAGLASRGGCYGDDSLVADNDCYNKSFSQIADIIESEPEGLFVESNQKEKGV